jgi:pimeloyl-ACP methyl ester carboxylesterase
MLKIHPAVTQEVTMPDDKPTIVLVHGAFADASGWAGVIKLLSAQGFDVLAPPNPLRSVTATRYAPS